MNQPRLTYERLFTERHQIYCAGGHPLFERAPYSVEPRELEETDWVVRAYEMPQTIHFARPPIATAISHYMEGIAHFILAGTHVGYLPDHLARHWTDRGVFRPILPETYFYELPMSLATREDMGGERRIRAVRQIILDMHT